MVLLIYSPILFLILFAWSFLLTGIIIGILIVLKKLIASLDDAKSGDSE